jgi:hypothetical protein
MLRDEVAAAADPSNRATALEAFDALASQDVVRAEALKVVQRYLKRVAAYVDTIDGDWGKNTEDAYLRLFPSALGHMTRLVDLAVLSRDSGGAVGLARALAAGISRDNYLLSADVAQEHQVLDSAEDPVDDWGTPDDLTGTGDAPATRTYATPAMAARASGLPFARAADEPDAEPFIDVIPGGPVETYGPMAPLEEGKGIGKTLLIGSAVVLATILGIWALRRGRKHATAGVRGMRMRSRPYRVPRGTRYLPARKVAR